MKNKITRRTVSLAIGLFAAAAVVVPAVSSAGSPNFGTDILHFLDRTTLTNEGVETNAGGKVYADQNEQGRANNQRLDIFVGGLETNTTYQLLTLFNDDTNLTWATNFSTDAKGKAALQYRSLGRGKGLGKGKSALPAALNPISEIRELYVFNSSTQAVLSADLTDPDRLQYLIKRNLSTNGVAAELFLKATARKTQFRLLAFGLAPTNDYRLVLNGDVTQTTTTDARGKLMIKSLAQNPTNILDLQSVELWDNSSNVVLSTQLP